MFSMAASSQTHLTHTINFHEFHHKKSKTLKFPHNINQLQFRKPIKITITVTNCISKSIETTQKIVSEFDPKIPIEEAVTPPTSWYTDPSFYSLELQSVFYNGWQFVGCVDQIKDAHSFFTGRLPTHIEIRGFSSGRPLPAMSKHGDVLGDRLGNVEYVICRDSDGEIHAFHNVCRHHASILACGSGKKTCFVCPYHGWTYGLDGSLLKAPRITGLQKFVPKEFGLVPIKVATWGPFIVVNLAASQEDVDAVNIENEWLGSSSKLLSGNGVDSSLSYICRREYTIDCNWKVFCDNYLDGGYHVPYAHKSLASGLDLDSYTTQIFERVSIQRGASSSTENGDDFDRLGSKVLYAFVYPNFMINRYGPWMDTNLVLPLGPRKCKVVFDYFLDGSLASDKAFIDRSLKDSEQVQMEDIVLCEGVQRGLESPAYKYGRYAPNVEKAMHHFHCLLHRSLS